MNREQSASFTMSLKQETVDNILKEVRIDELYKETLLYLYGKYNNSRFLT